MKDDKNLEVNDISEEANLAEVINHKLMEEKLKDQPVVPNIADELLEKKEKTQKKQPNKIDRPLVTNEISRERMKEEAEYTRDRLKENFNNTKEDIKKHFSSVGITDIVTGPIYLAYKAATFGIKALGQGLGLLGSAINEGAQWVSEGSRKLLDGAIDKFHKAEGANKVGWGAAVAICSALRIGGAACAITGKVADGALKVANESCQVVGCAASGEFGKSWSALTRVAANVTQTALDTVKETGTQLKSVGENVPLVNKPIVALGSGLQATSQALEGVSQGLRKVGVLEFKEAGKLMASGFVSAKETLVKNSSINSEVVGKDTEASKENSKYTQSHDGTQNRKMYGLEFDDRMKAAIRGLEVDNSQKNEKIKPPAATKVEESARTR
jgi:hypothetical protein